MGDRLGTDASDLDVTHVNVGPLTSDAGCPPNDVGEAAYRGEASRGGAGPQGGLVRGGGRQGEIVQGEVVEGEVVEGEVVEGDAGFEQRLENARARLNTIVLRGEIVPHGPGKPRAGSRRPAAGELTDEDPTWFPLQSLQTKERLPWGPDRGLDHALEVQSPAPSRPSPDPDDDDLRLPAPGVSAAPRRHPLSRLLSASGRLPGELPPLLADPGEVLAPQPGTTAPLRLALGVTSLASLVLAGAGMWLGLGGLRTAGVLFFCFLGTGSAPWQLNLALDAHARLALSFVTSLAVMTLIPFETLVLDEWYPGLTFALITVVCTVLHLVGLVAALATGSGPGPPLGARLGAFLRSSPRKVAGRRRTAPAALPALVGASACLVAALTHQHIDPGFYGFLPRIGPLWFVGLGLVLLGVVLGVAGGAGAALSTFLLTAVLTLTPALTYDGPRSQSAGKHVDFVTQIQTLHQLDTPVAVYNAWSGFFAAMAWLCQVAGIDDPMRLATFWPALLAVIRLTVLRFVAGQVLPSRQQCWAVVALAVLADSIGADYFSPQSVGFVVGVAAVGFALARSPEVPRLTMVLLCGLVLAVSHQFSPYAAGGILVILVLFRQIRPWWTPALVLVPAVAWAVAHAAALRGMFDFSMLGRAQNFRPPETVTAPGLERLLIVRETVVALVAGILLLGLLAAVTLLRHRRDRRYWALACSPAAGLAIVAVNPYGQEGIFRAALFGLPWLAMLAAPLLTGPAVRMRLGFLATSAALLVAFLVSSFGLDAINVIRPADLAAVRYFEEHGGPRPPTTHYLLLLGTGDLPTSPGLRGGWHQIWGRDRLGYQLPGRQPPMAAGAEQQLLTSRFVRLTADPTAPPTLFALWSPVSALYGRTYGLQSIQQADALRDAFEASPFWSVAYTRDGTYVFRYEPAGRSGRRR